MLNTGTLLIKIAGIVFLPILVVSMVLGYSGSTELAGAGNVILLLALALCLPLAVAGAVMKFVGRRQLR